MAPSKPGRGAKVATAVLGAKRRALAEDRDLHDRRERRKLLQGVGLAAALAALAVLVLHFLPWLQAGWAAFRAHAPLWLQAVLVLAPIGALAAMMALLLRRAVRDGRERFLDKHFEGHRMVGLAAGDGGLAYLKQVAEPLAEALHEQEPALQARKVLVVNPHQAVKRWDRRTDLLGHLEHLGCNPAEDSYAAAVADKHALRHDVVGRLERWRDLGPDYRHVHLFVGLGTEPGRGHTGVSSLEVLAPEVLGRFPRAMVVVDLMTHEVTPPAVDPPEEVEPAELEGIPAEGGS